MTLSPGLRQADRRSVTPDYYYYATAGGKKIWVRLDPGHQRMFLSLTAEVITVEEVLDHDADHPIRHRSLCGLLWQ